jgi:hypothetical protein
MAECCIGYDVPELISDWYNTSTARDASDLSLSQVWTFIISSVSKFTRTVRNQLVPQILDFLGGDALTSYSTFYERQQRHIALVRHVMRHSLGVSTCQHDYSKDAYYIFVLCGKFCSNVSANGVLFTAEFQSEVERHYSLEAHHPEYEAIHGVECKSEDIVEMAVDRLVCNITENNGHIEWEQMNLYLPTFTVGDVNNKLKLYQQHLTDYEPIVQRAYSSTQGGCDISENTSITQGGCDISENTPVPTTPEQE